MESVAVVGPEGVRLNRVGTVVSRLQEEGFEVLERRPIEGGTSVALLIRRDVDAYSTLGKIERELEYTTSSRSELEAIEDKRRILLAGDSSKLTASSSAALVSTTSSEGSPSAASPARPYGDFERSLIVLKPGLDEDGIADAKSAVAALPDAIIVSCTEATLGEEAARAVRVPVDASGSGGDDNGGNQDEDEEDEELAYLTGSPSTIIVVEGYDVAAKLRILAGPDAPADARATHPNSLRAKFGINPVHNGAHVSRDAEAAAAEIGVVLTAPLARERLLVVVAGTSAAATIASLEETGFTVATRKTTIAETGETREAIVATKPAAWATWEALTARTVANVVSATTSEVEIKRVFPRARGEPQKLSSDLDDAVAQALTHLCRVKKVGLDAVRELAHYLLDHNPNKPLVQLPDDE